MARKTMFSDIFDVARFRYPIAATFAYAAGLTTGALLIKNGVPAGGGVECYILDPAAVFAVTGVAVHAACSSAKFIYDSATRPKRAEVRGGRVKPLSFES